jgi:hypothetical protein
LAIGDFQINSRVRGIFAKHWLDTSQLSIVTIKGNVYVGGVVKKLSAVSRHVEVNEELMETIDFEVKRIKDVKRITYRFEDWRKEGGKFVSMRKTKESPDEKKHAEDVAKRTGYEKDKTNETS